MTDTEKKTDEDKSNEMLKRMLETPPSPKEKGGDKSRRPPASDQDL